MENFVLYDEIGKRDGMIIYKGRRKGTIAFLAICCVEKNYRAEITNHVRFVHEFSHPNVVNFFEWYETSNHLWLVIELCTGGSLEQIISEDEHLPENAIRKFGSNLVKGLFYMHSMEVMFTDWSPKNIMLDGQGTLKFFDFSLARKLDENIDDLFEQFMEGMEDGENFDYRKRDTRGNPSYIAPEIWQDQRNNELSDLWGLGCLLYQMYCGVAPFTGASEEQIADRVVYRDYAPLRVKGPRITSKASAEFSDLIHRLLTKSPKERATLTDVILHPFWMNELKDLACQIAPHMAEQISVPRTPLSDRNNCESNTPKDVLFKSRISTVGVVKTIDSSQNTARLQNKKELQVNDLDDPISERSQVSRMHECRPRTASEQNKDDVSFTMHVGGSRNNLAPISGNGNISSPHVEESTVRNNMQPVGDPAHHSSTTKTTKSTKTPGTPGNRSDAVRTPGSGRSEGQRSTRQASGGVPDLTDRQQRLMQLVVLEDEARPAGQVPLIDTNKLLKSGQLKFDAKILPVPPFSTNKLKGLPPQERNKHMSQLLTAFSTFDRGPPSQKRLQLINYLTTLCLTPPLAQDLYEHYFCAEIVRQLRESSHSELRTRLLRFVTCIFLNLESLDSEINLTDIAVLLTEILRENFRVARVKQAVLPAIGELLCKVALAEATLGRQIGSWSIPPMTITQITRCLHKNEDVTISLIATRIIENIGQTQNNYIQAFATNEVAQLLWTTYKHSTLDALRISSMVALCQLSRMQSTIFQNVVDKVGLPALIENLHIGLLKVQQSILTMFAISLISNSHSSTSKKLIQDKHFIQSIMRMFESPSSLIRAKTFLIIVAVLDNSIESLSVCCNQRLVLYIERDMRRQTPSTSAHNRRGGDNNEQTLLDQSAHIAECLEILLELIAESVPKIAEEIISALDAVAGRKHPSSLQAKKLKQWLFLLPCFIHFVSSHTLRSRILTNDFMHFLGQLLQHCHSIDINETNISAALVGGSPSTGINNQIELITTALSIVEFISQHGPIVIKYSPILINEIMPSLAKLCSTSSNIDLRLVSLKLFGDFASYFLGDSDHSNSQIEATQDELNALGVIIETVLFPQGEFFLLEQEQSASYFLKLLINYLSRQHRGVITFQRYNLVAVLMQLLLEHQSSVTSSTMRQALQLLGVLVGLRETNMKELFYELDLVTILSSSLLEIGNVCLQEENRLDAKVLINLLLASMEALNTVLRYVSDVVRRALQAKKSGNNPSMGGKHPAFDATSAEAEQLLLVAKPFTDLVGLLCQLLCHDDYDVSESALRALSNLASLYGGEHAEAMTPENMHCLVRALAQCDLKKQRLMLRIIKRLLVTDRSNIDRMRENSSGQALLQAIEDLLPSARAQADATVQNLVKDIVQLIK